MAAEDLTEREARDEPRTPREAGDGPANRDARPSSWPAIGNGKNRIETRTVSVLTVAVH